MDINHFVSEYIPGLTSEIAAGSIYKYIEKELGLHISYSQRVIEVQPCTEDDRKYLDLNGTDYVVVVKNFTHLYDGSQFEYTESRHRLDIFHFSDVARENKEMERNVSSLFIKMTNSYIRVLTNLYIRVNM